MVRLFLSLILLVAAQIVTTGASAQDNPEINREARAIFQQLIEINTTDSVGNVTTAAEAMAQRFRDAGFAEQDVIVAGPNARKKIWLSAFAAQTSGRRFSLSVIWM